MLAGSGPGLREQFVEPVVRPEIDESGEHVCEIGFRIDAIQFARVDERCDGGPILGAVIVAGEESGPKLYSLHAPEVECIGKGKAHKPYEFGVKVSVATPIKHSKGGQFVAHVAALPGNPGAVPPVRPSGPDRGDGHTLAKVIPAMEALIGNVIERMIADAGYRGHNAPPDYRYRIFTAGQKHRVTPKIKREMKRRSAVEPVIGHLKEDHRMGRNYLAHRAGDAANAVPAAAGYNFRLILAWLRLLLRQILIAIFVAFIPPSALKQAS